MGVYVLPALQRASSSIDLTKKARAPSLKLTTVVQVDLWQRSSRLPEKNKILTNIHKTFRDFVILSRREGDEAAGAG